MTAACNDDSLSCSLSRIADALTAEWSLLDWLVSVAVPLAAVAASVLIGIASLRLAGAANRISAQSRASDEAREVREGRGRFALEALAWIDARWTEVDLDDRRLQEEKVLAASLKVKSSALTEPGIEFESAKSVVDSISEAWEALEQMPPIERSVSSPIVGAICQTLVHSFAAMPEALDRNLAEFTRRLEAVRADAKSGKVREELKQALLTAQQDAGIELSEGDVDAALDAFEADRWKDKR